MNTAIILGANGQDGYYLNKLLKENEIEVTGVSRTGDWMHTDISDYKEVVDLIKHHQPDCIFHLAANSTTKHDALFENHTTISTVSLNILEAVKLYSPLTKVFLSGSGLQFVNTGMPIKETDPFMASSAYAVSRIQSVYAARYYRSMGIKAYVGYFFNHESPMRPERHMSKKIACAVKRIANGSEELMEIGDISVKKEWTFAGDVVRGIYTLVLQDEIFEANLGSGLAYSIEDWLSECFQLIGKEWKNFVKLSDNFHAEYKILVSDPAIISSLGWKPEVSLSALAKIMVAQ